MNKLNQRIAEVEKEIKLYRDKKEITDKNIAIWTAYHEALGKREGLLLGKQAVEEERKKLLEKINKIILNELNQNKHYTAYSMSGEFGKHPTKNCLYCQFLESVKEQLNTQTENKE